MAFTKTILPRAIDRYFDLFSENQSKDRRLFLTALDGSHLIGVPKIFTHSLGNQPPDMFTVITEQGVYEVPFVTLAWAAELTPSSGLRPSDGGISVPEPCQGPNIRPKGEKFSILDAPTLLRKDIQNPSATLGSFGYALLYIDIDKFKDLNSKYTETVIDETILPQFQHMIEAMVRGHGHAYAEGGDEITILLTNATENMAIAFAESLRVQISETEFPVQGKVEKLTVSIGVSSSKDKSTISDYLVNWANEAKQHSKEQGRNCTTVKDDRGLRKIPTT